jgi:electron transport complex protein RnfD
MSDRFSVASSPHWRYAFSLSAIQRLWLLALTPAAVVSVLMYGWHSLRVMGLAVFFAVILDAAANRLIPSRDSTANYSSVTLAILLAFMMPYDASWWLILVGCFIMIVVGKKLFGGTGAYPVHPAMLSFAMLLVSWPGRFDYTGSVLSLDWGTRMVEPLRLVKTLGGGVEEVFLWQDLLMGRQVAGIGNGLVLYLLIGGLFLILIRRIPWHIPLAFLVGHAFMAWILNLASPAEFASPLFYLLSGGTVFAAFFLATEYTTSPVNPIPRLIYGFLGGLLLMLIRAFSSYSDGVVFTILLINLCNPLLDRIRPRVYGVEVTGNA